MSKTIDDVINQLRSAGLAVDTVDVDTSDIVRVPVDGDKGSKKSGWYRVYTHVSKAGNTYYVGRFGNWKNDAIPENGENLKFDDSGLTADDRKAIKAQQEKARKQAAAEKKRKQADAARRAKDIWGKLPEPVPDSPVGNPYLVKKKIGAFGVRYAKNNALVVPLRTVSGDLVGLQFIAADGPKRFLTGTAKKAAIHVIGQLDAEGAVIISEGYADAATIHTATGVPAVVGFDATNLPSVALALRAEYPRLRIIFAADDDKAGRSNAEKAASEVGGVVVLPCFADSSKAGKDFSDLYLAEGMGPVVDQFKAAIAGELEPAKVIDPVKSLPAKTKTPQSNTGNSSFVSTSEELKYYRDEHSDGQTISGPIEVLGVGRREDNREYGVFVRFRNLEGIEMSHLIPYKLFSGDSREVLSQLLDMGFRIMPGRDPKVRLIEYLQSAQSANYFRLVSKLGWNKGCFLQPGHQIGNPDEPLHYHSSRLPACTAAVSGSLGDWQEGIGRLCVGNPLLAFCVSVAFSAPLLRLVNAETFGVHLYGDSSKGKSTALYAASSVCGGPDYLKRWNSTSNALEPIAAEHSDSLLVLDEISQSLPHEIGNSVYMLGNEQGKARSNDTGSSTRQRLSWRLVYLSSGEHTLDQHMDSANRKSLAGQQVRLVNILATNFKYGAFDDIHGYASAGRFAEHIKHTHAKAHGAPFRAFVEKLCDQSAGERNKMLSYIERVQIDFQNKWLTGKASGQAGRVASAVALVGVAGEIAIKWGILPWSPGQALSAADQLFNSWLGERGGEGDKEDRDLLAHLASELLGKGESYFTRWDGAEDDATTDTHQIRSQERWGFKRNEKKDFGPSRHSEDIYYVFKVKFREGLCRGYNYKRAVELLRECGALKESKGRSGMYRTLLPTGGEKLQDVYAIRSSALHNYDLGRAESPEPDSPEYRESA